MPTFKEWVEKRIKEEEQEPAFYRAEGLAYQDGVLAALEEVLKKNKREKRVHPKHILYLKGEQKMALCNQDRIKCNFRKTGGICIAASGPCTSIVEQCLTAGAKLKEGTLPCSKINGNLCSAFLYPDKKWQPSCPLRSMSSAPVEERKVNPLKASKQKAKGH